MAEYTIKENFISEREITIEADNIEEAKTKYQSGDWASGVETDFYANEVMNDPHGITA